MVLKEVLTVHVNVPREGVPGRDKGQQTRSLQISTDYVNHLHYLISFSVREMRI